MKDVIDIFYEYDPKYIKDIENPIFYATEFASGFDLYADIDNNIELDSLERCLIPTGLYFNLNTSVLTKTVGYDENHRSYYLKEKGIESIETEFLVEMQIRSRSGLALNNGIIVLNSPGTVDNDYTGEIKVILLNTSKSKFTVEPKMRIAQAVVSFIPRNNVKIIFSKKDELSQTVRGENGFGSTNLK